MGIRPSKVMFYESCFSFEKLQSKTERHSKHGEICPISNSRIRLLECDSRID